MTPEEFERRMNEVFKDYKGDTESAHVEADRLMCELLRQLGYGGGIDIFENADRWYS